MFFQSISESPPDPVFGLVGAFKADKRKEKVDLLVGIYKDENLHAELIPTVKKAKEQIFNQDLMAGYLPMDGLKEMVDLLTDLLFGRKEERIYGVHTAGGTGALRVGFEFLAETVGNVIHVPNYTWGNHHLVIEKAGCKAQSYPYYSKEKRGFDFDAMVAALKKLPEKSIVLLHACCHNPTGSDPTSSQWKELSLVMREKKLLPFFDIAYQGFGKGIEKDAESIRIFLEDGHEMLVAYSCSKNFSMYCQRVGTLFVVGKSGADKNRIAALVKRIIRALYSNPPAHGAFIVAEILRREELFKSWMKDLSAMRDRLTKTRNALVDQLGSDFEYLRGHQGMFSFVDLDKDQVKKMIEQFGIYLLDNGRISIAGLNSENGKYVAESILSVSGKL